jgi:low affinity Fe/Cu permease
MAVQTQPDDRSTVATRAVSHVTGWLGSFPAILMALLVVVGWFLAGFLVVEDGFRNDLHQLVVTAGTAIITFWMVFVIQSTQNRDNRAMQAKIDAQSEVLRSIAEALDLDVDQFLTETVGLEDAPDHIIKQDQDRVRANVGPS